MVGGDEAAERDDAGVGEQFADFPNASDVLRPVLRTEPKVLIQSVADVVAIEDVGEPVPLDEDVFGREGDRALARTGETGQPDQYPILFKQSFTLLSPDVTLVPDNIRCFNLCHSMPLGFLIELIARALNKPILFCGSSLDRFSERRRSRVPPDSDRKTTCPASLGFRRGSRPQRVRQPIPNDSI